MDVKIEPSKLSGSIVAIPSKSYAHRILTACALADSSTTVLMNFSSNDIFSAIQALTAFGANINIEKDRVIVSPMEVISYLNANCGESGTMARFLLPVATALYDNGVITGEGSLLNRPFETLCDALEKNGCSFISKRLPVSFRGKTNPGSYLIRGDESSQYISGLLFALPLLNGDSEITLTTPLESSGYVDMTLHVLRMFGIEINWEHGVYKIKGGQKYKSPGIITVEGDWSNAAFWLAVGIEVTGLHSGSLQKDRLFLELKDSNEIDALDVPDLVPILSVVAASKINDTVIYNIKRLRYKESDRIESTVAMLLALGGKVTTYENKIIISGCGKLRGGTVDSTNDHRIVMSASIASCFCEQPVIIAGTHAVNKTYPDFFKAFNMLGGKAIVV